MGRGIVLAVISGIVVLGLIGFSESAFAVTTQVNPGNCELPPYNGVYDGSTCTIPGTLFIPAGDEFQTSNLILKITGTLNLEGRLATSNPIVNAGIINVQGGNQIEYGSINIFSGGYLINECDGEINLIGGTAEFTGVIALSPPVTFTNFGTINGFNSDSANNIGSIFTLGLANNYGTINAPVDVGNLGAFFDDLPSLCSTDPTIIDADTIGNQLVGPDDILIITNGATLTGDVSIDGGLLIVERSASIDGTITSENGGGIQLLENCSVSGNIKTTNSRIFIESCSVDGFVKPTGGFLVIKNDSTINGNVNVESADYVTILNNENSFNQNVRVEDTNSVQITGNHVTENLRVKDSGTVSLFGNTVLGSLRSFDNESTRVIGNTVTGNLNTRGTDDVDIVSNTVNGNLRVSDSPVRVLVQGNTVGENLRVKDSSNVVVVNNNSIGKNLRVIGNDIVFVGNNHPTNNLNIKDNIDCTFDKNTAGNKLKIKDCIQIPSITPTGGQVGTSFTILDGLGRMIVPEGCSGVVLFTPTNPSIPPQAILDPVFSADGTSVSGVVQFENLPYPSGFIDVTVHPCDASDEPFFEDVLQFIISTPGGGL